MLVIALTINIPSYDIFAAEGKYMFCRELFRKEVIYL